MCKYLKRWTLSFPGRLGWSARLALNELVHSGRQIGTGGIDRDALRFFLGGGRTIAAQRASAEHHANLASVSVISEGGERDKNNHQQDKSGAGNHRPLFSVRHDELLAREEIAHLAEFLIPLLNNFVGGKSGKLVQRLNKLALQ